MLSQLLSGYAKAFGNAPAIAGFGRCKHNHSTAAAHRRPLGSTVDKTFMASKGFSVLIACFILIACSCNDNPVDTNPPEPSRGFVIDTFHVAVTHRQAMFLFVYHFEKYEGFIVRYQIDAAYNGLLVYATYIGQPMTLRPDSLFRRQDTITFYQPLINNDPVWVKYKFEGQFYYSRGSDKILVGHFLSKDSMLVIPPIDSLVLPNKAMEPTEQGQCFHGFY